MTKKTTLKPKQKKPEPGITFYPPDLIVKNSPGRGRGAALGLGFSGLYNHKPEGESNAEYWATTKYVRITAECNIKKGEEVFIDYGWEGKEFV